MEKLDIIDKNGKITGEVRDRKDVHKFGLLHHASGVVFVARTGGGFCILSQQRSFNKEKNAGLWDLSASGHISAGEDPLKSLIREIKEEIGLNINESQFKLLGKFWRNEVYRADFIENELDYIYIVENYIDISQIKIQEDEVETVAWINVKKFKTMMKEGKVVKRDKVWQRLFEFLK